MPKLDPKKEPGLYPDAWARFERAVDVVDFKPAPWLEQIGHKRRKQVDDRKHRMG
jgi:hypothetical protein